MHNMPNHIRVKPAKPQFHGISLWFVSSTSLRCGIHNNRHTKWPRFLGWFLYTYDIRLGQWVSSKKGWFSKGYVNLLEGISHTHIYIYHISYISQALFTSLFIVPTMALWMHEKPPKKCRHWSSHGDQSIAINIMINEG